MASVNGDHASQADTLVATESQLHSPDVVPDIIPPEHPFRTLVLCFDGTGDQFDADNSNIVALFSMLKKDDRTKQMCYYQAGIGTYTTPKIASPMASKISKTLDMMVAWDLDAHVMDGYEFLMQNYTAGDRICIFGFSRGAYTARALAGMVHKVGLLPACNHQQVPFAYKMFTQADENGWKQSNAFKKCFSVDVDIEFIGVWDTVNSVGLIPRRLPFTTSNTAVRTFRHAVALDERRAKFKANLWNRPTPTEAKLGTDGLPKPKKTKTKNNNKKPSPPKKSGSWIVTGGGTTGHGRGGKLRGFEMMYEKPRDTPTDIEEVWFAGCHCDVGGGSVSNDTPYSLARIPLRWMIRECFKTATGIMFDAAQLRTVGLDPASLYPLVLPRPPALAVGNTMRIQRIPKAGTKAGTKAPSSEAAAAGGGGGAAVADAVAAKSGDGKASREALLEHHAYHPEEGEPAPAPAQQQQEEEEEKEEPEHGHHSEEEEELRDALMPIYDQLSLAPYWWALEVLPMKHKYQKGDNSWTSKYGWNLGGPRVIPKQIKRGFKVHRSVKMRMQADHEAHPGVKYKPQTKWLAEPTWVD